MEGDKAGHAKAKHKQTWCVPASAQETQSGVRPERQWCGWRVGRGCRGGNLQGESGQSVVPSQALQPVPATAVVPGNPGIHLGASVGGSRG